MIRNKITKSNLILTDPDSGLIGFPEKFTASNSRLSVKITIMY